MSAPSPSASQRFSFGYTRAVNSFAAFLPGLLGLSLALFACERVDRDEAGYERDPPGAWYAGDMHVHATGASNDTGGDSLPQDIKRVAMQRGLSFVVLTDHSNSTGSDVTTTDEDPALFNQGPEFPYWERAAELSEPGRFLMIDGNEISPIGTGDIPGPTGHIGCAPMDLQTFDREGAFIDRPRGEVSGGECLEQALARGCFAVINHPLVQASWIRYDWSGVGYHGIEVWNGGLGFDDSDRDGVDLWRCDLLSGKSVTPIAASDNHRVNIEPPGLLLGPALGSPRTSVFASALTWPAIVEALLAGRVSLHEGESFLQLDAYDQNRVHVSNPQDARIFRMRGRLDPSVPRAMLTLKRAFGCDDPRPDARAPSVQEEVIFVRAITGGSSFDAEKRLDQIPEGGVYTAELLPEEGINYFALSGAFVKPL